ncbi:hypothetical protein ABK040_002234 [Willaertia magna]
MSHDNLNQIRKSLNNTNETFITTLKQNQKNIESFINQLKKKEEILIQREIDIKQKELELEQRELKIEKAEQEIEEKLQDKQKEVLEKETFVNEIIDKLEKTTLIENKHKNNQVIKLDIGGQYFKTLLNTLLNEKDTFFTHYFSDNFARELDDEGRYFIDRNPSNFHLILDHLRGMNILLNINEMNDVKLSQFIQDIVYFNITSLYNKIPTRGYKFLKENGIELKEYGINLLKFDENYCLVNAQLSCDNTRVKKINGGNNWNCGVMGSTNCYHYKIKIIQTTSNTNFMMGFAYKSKFKPNSSNYSSCGWYLYCNNGTLYSEKGDSGKSYTNQNMKSVNGMIIEAIYDPDKKTISFKVNNVDCGIAFIGVENLSNDLSPAFDLNDQGFEFEFIE